MTHRSWLWPIQFHEKSISSHSFENFLTIPLPISSSLQCAKNSSYLESLGQKITKNHEKSISSHSFENFLTIPLPNSSSLQCAKNSAYLESLQHFIWILAKKFFRLGHNRDLINLDMTQLTWIWPNGHGYDPWVTVIVSPTDYGSINIEVKSLVRTP